METVTVPVPVEPVEKNDCEKANIAERNEAYRLWIHYTHRSRLEMERATKEYDALKLSYEETMRVLDGIVALPYSEAVGDVVGEVVIRAKNIFSRLSALQWDLQNPVCSEAGLKLQHSKRLMGHGPDVIKHE